MNLQVNSSWDYIGFFSLKDLEYEIRLQQIAW